MKAAGEIALYLLALRGLHTFATNWLRVGGKLERLSIAMGHASIRTTFDLYGHLDDGDTDADLALIEDRA